MPVAGLAPSTSTWGAATSELEIEDHGGGALSRLAPSRSRLGDFVIRRTHGPAGAGAVAEVDEYAPDFEPEDDPAPAPAPAAAPAAAAPEPEVEYAPDFEPEDDPAPAPAPAPALGPAPAPAPAAAPEPEVEYAPDFEPEDEADPMAEALAWCQQEGLPVAADRILDPTLTPDNCHSHTFGEDDERFSHERAIELWRRRGEPRILVYFKEGVVAHTATYRPTTNDWEQTLPGGPVFRCSRDEVMAWGGYVRVLDTEDDRAAFLAPEMAAIARWRARRAVLLDVCRPYGMKPSAALRGEEQYLARWYFEALDEEQYSVQGSSTFEDRLSQVPAMLAGLRR